MTGRVGEDEEKASKTTRNNAMPQTHYTSKTQGQAQCLHNVSTLLAYTSTHMEYCCSRRCPQAQKNPPNIRKHAVMPNMML